MQAINFIAENPVVATFLALIAVVSLIFTYRSTPQKKLKFIISDTELINNKQSELQKLSIYYDGKNVEKLSVTKVTFWNAAFPAIRRTDIAATDPITISSTEDTILDVSVLKGDNTANKISIKTNSISPYCIDFEYLNRREGGIIQVVHIGSFKSINVTKTLIDGKIRISKNPSANTVRVILEALGTTLLSSVGATSVIALALYVGVPQWISGIIFILVLFGMIAIMIYFQMKEFIPRNCRK